jgi:hypothetical protein
MMSVGERLVEGITLTLRSQSLNPTALSTPWSLTSLEDLRGGEVSSYTRLNSSQIEYQNAL